MPMNLTLAQLLGYERFSRNEAKLAYIKLNIQTLCPPRGAVPVNQGPFWSFSLSAPGSTPVMDATASSYVTQLLARTLASRQQEI